MKISFRKNRHYLHLFILRIITDFSVEDFRALLDYLKSGIVGSTPQEVEILIKMLDHYIICRFHTYDNPVEFLRIKLYEEWYRRVRHNPALKYKVTFGNNLLKITNEDIATIGHAFMVRFIGGSKLSTRDLVSIYSSVNYEIGINQYNPICFDGHTCNPSCHELFSNSENLKEFKKEMVEQYKQQLQKYYDTKMLFRYFHDLGYNLAHSSIIPIESLKRKNFRDYSDRTTKYWIYKEFINEIFN